MFRIFGLTIITSFAILTFIASAAAQLSIPGQVIDVIDGKTVLVALPNGSVKVQLQYIDVPDTGQQLHDTVKEHLRNLVIGKTVQYRTKNILNDRMIGRLVVNNIDVSQQMLRDGAAWHLPPQMSGQENDEYQTYASFEMAAKNEKLGVWSIRGLKPAWEVRADREIAKQKEQNSFSSNSGPGSRASNSNRVKAISNPAFANVGALLAKYDPESKTGLLSTAMMSIDVDKSLFGVEKIAIDVTYYYKENVQKKRSGSFVFTAVFISKKAQLFANNDLIVWDNQKKTTIGKPKRTVSIQGDDVNETLVYEISRSELQRVTNNEVIFLKIGQHLIHLTGARYLLYNMLQVTQ